MQARASGYKVLVVDDVHEALFPPLKALGLQIDYRPDILASEVFAPLRKAQVLVVRSKVHVDARFLALAPQLKIVARAGAGMDNIDEVAAAAKGLVLLNAPEGNCDAVAEHALGMMLGLAAKLGSGDASVRRGEWLREAHRGIELRGRTLGIVGYGHTGRALAWRAAALGMQVIAYDKYAPASENDLAQAVTLEELQAKAEVVSLHIPLTEETNDWVDSAWLAKLARKPILLNTSRGKVFNQNDALVALEAGQISGLGMDVLAQEPPLKTDPIFLALTQRNDTFLTPHVAGWTQESYRRISEVLAAKLVRYFERFPIR